MFNFYRIICTGSMEIFVQGVGFYGDNYYKRRFTGKLFIYKCKLFKVVSFFVRYTPLLKSFKNYFFVRPFPIHPRTFFVTVRRWA